MESSRPVEASSPPARILLVDDDPCFLSSVEALLALDFDVVTSASPDEALRLPPYEFHVVCADYNMPHITGLELLERVTQRSPSTCCLLVTGADDFFEMVKQTSYRPPVVFKPLDPERFIGTVTHLVSLAQMKRATRVMAASTASSWPPPSVPSPGSQPPSSRSHWRPR